MATSIKSTALDFDLIKSNLKSHLASQSEFSDYDFETSGLSNILDVLAYNTHMNGLTANLALNESFLNSAQLRSSVVSHAENLGYYPSSQQASQGYVKLKITGTGVTTVNNIEMPQYSSFTTTIDNVSYKFLTTEKYIGTNDGLGNFTFKTSAGSENIPIKEGTRKTKTFIVGNTTDDQVFVIPDTTIDTSTLTVNIYETVSSSLATVYTNIKNSTNVTSTSTIYIIRESPNGYYEITFSEGNVLGKAPTPGNKIVIDYISNKAAAPNGADSWVADFTIDVDGDGKKPTAELVSAAAGGSEKESISSIKVNAPLAFAAQQRMVTAEDYKSVINANYSALIEDIICWGGQDNIPATFGNTYVCIKYKTGVDTATQTETENAIKTQLSANLAVMSIDTVFVNSEDTYVEASVSFDFDPNLTGDSLETTQVNVKNKVREYFNTNLNAFGKIFRRSSILTEIDALTPAILNSSMTVKIQRRIISPDNITFGTDNTIKIIYPITLSAPDDKEYRITSTKFTYEGVPCSIRNKLSSNTLEIIDETSGIVINDNAGNYEEANGIVNIVGVNITAYEGEAIKISVTPENQSTIKPLRNHILSYDYNLSRSDGTIDNQNTLTVL